MSLELHEKRLMLIKELASVEARLTEVNKLKKKAQVDERPILIRKKANLIGELQDVKLELKRFHARGSMPVEDKKDLFEPSAELDDLLK